MRLRMVRNEQGIALVTALMMTLISMAIIMSILYMINQSVANSGTQKRYKSALEAAYGGSELVIKEIMPQIFQNLSSSKIASNFSSLGMTIPTKTACLEQKLRFPTSQWGAGLCDSSNSTLSPTTSPDIKFRLQGTNGQYFNVFTKIVDTVQGNTDTSGVLLTGYGVTETPSISYAQHIPYIYRVEIQGQREQNPVERANLSVVYAY